MTAPVSGAAHRLGYRFAPPAGWLVQEGTLDWNDGAVVPDFYSPAFDTFTLSQDELQFIEIGTRGLSGATTLRAWVRQLTDASMLSYPGQCTSVEHERRTTLGGEPATIRAFHCPVTGPNGVAAHVLTTHRGQGWLALCFSKTERISLGAFERRCDDWLSSFAFLS